MSGEVAYSELHGRNSRSKSQQRREGRGPLSLGTYALRLACVCGTIVAAGLALCSSTSLVKRHAWEWASTRDTLGDYLSSSSAPSNWTYSIEVSSKYASWEDSGMAGFDFGKNELLCTAYKLPRHQQTLRSLKPIPSGDRNALHHMILYSCENLPEAEILNSGDAGAPPVWRCDSASRNRLEACGKGAGQLIWGWGFSAPGVRFDDEHAFVFEERTKDRYIVLESHYQPSKTGSESVGRIEMAFHSVPPRNYLNLAMVGTTALDIPGGSEFVEFSTKEFCVSGSEQIELYAYRIHTHQFGKRVALMVNGEEIFDGLPNEPHGQDWIRPEPMSVMIPPQTPFKVHCEYNTTEATEDRIYFGSSPNSDMCILYLMTASEQRMNWYSWGTFTNQGVTAFNYPIELGQRLKSRLGTLTAISRGDVGPLGLGNVGGMHFGIGKEKHFMYVFHRAGRHLYRTAWNKLHTTPINADPIVVWDLENRRQVRSFGSGLAYLPHGIIVDLEGNLWITDVDSQMVHKLDPHGRVLMKVGTKGQIGSGEYTFCRPTEVAVASDGRFFVSDGYCNSRVVEYSADGKFVREYTIPDGNIVHNVLYDESKDQLWVNDRWNSKLYVFSVKEASLVKEIDVSEYGYVYAFTMDSYGNIHALTWRRPPNWPQDGRVFFLPMLNLGIAKGSVKGALLDDLGLMTPFFPHTLAASYDPSKKTVVAFVGQVSPSPVGKITKYEIAV